MPYVKERRTNTGAPLAGEASALNPGELNYQFTAAVVLYIEENGLSYRTINDVMGALEGAKQEFYRRVAVPYEDGKRVANGDVYPEWMTSNA